MINYFLREAEEDNGYKSRLLAVMRENNSLGISNEIYEDTISTFTNNKATFNAVYTAGQSRFIL